MLTIHGRKTSYNVQKVTWIAAELGVPNRRLDVGGRFGGLDTPEFRAMNPNGRIPVIEDEGKVIWESNAIVRYLASRYGGEAWWPSDPATHAQGDQWMEWAGNNLNVGFLGLFMGFYRTPETKRDWTAIKANLERCAADYGLLDRVLAKRPFIAGETISVGDIPIGATLFRYFTLDIERPKLPNVEAYYRRLTERPAYSTHVMVPYEELKG